MSSTFRCWVSARTLSWCVVTGAALTAFVPFVALPAREAARQAAREVQSKNDLFQHSGFHPFDSARVNDKGEVVTVSSCPVCSQSNAKVNFSDERGRSVEESALRPETIEQAALKLKAFKDGPRYRQLRESFAHVITPTSREKNQQ